MQIGSYQVLFEVARGGMGAIFLARAVGAGGFERLVAIKRTHEHLLSSTDAADRFLDEARLAAYVHHANVVSVHQAGLDEEGHYLVCDYVEGASLGQLIRCASELGQRMSPAIVLRIAIDALAGLHAVHETTEPCGAPLTILHRDISAQNLLVGRDGVTRLTDFGIAKSAASSVLTDENYVVGKVMYLTPEYLRRLPVDRTLDVYAMGVTLWIALSGEHPWLGASEAQMLEAILSEGVPPLSSTGLELHPLIEEVVARACHRERAQRYQTAREMLDALEDVGAQTGQLASYGEVAEYVEAMVGAELAARRDAIKRQRAELAAAELADAQTRPDATVKLTQTDGLEDHDQDHTTKQHDSIRDDASGAVGGVDSRAWQRRWPRRAIVYAGILATALAAIHVLSNGDGARKPEPALTIPLSVKATSGSTAVVPTPRITAAPAAYAARPAVAPVVVEEATEARPAERRRSSRRAAARRASRPSPDPAHFDQISTVNPYR
jgi:eukaryotic-like serine/threonine-protein kinase